MQLSHNNIEKNKSDIQAQESITSIQLFSDNCPRKNLMWESWWSRWGYLLIFSNNLFTKKYYTEYWDTSERNTWDNFSPPPGEVLTPWRPSTLLCATSASACVRTTSPVALSHSSCLYTISHMLCVTSSSISDWCWYPPLPSPCYSPSEIELLLVKNRFPLGYWVFSRCVSK